MRRPRRTFVLRVDNPFLTAMQDALLWLHLASSLMPRTRIYQRFLLLSSQPEQTSPTVEPFLAELCRPSIVYPLSRDSVHV